MKNFYLKGTNTMMPSQNEAVLRFVKLPESALTPRKGSPRAMCFNLRSAYDTTVPARGKMLISTDLQIQLPDGCYGRIAPRSGLALEHHIDVGDGIVDEDYRGNFGVILYNHSDIAFIFSRGDRIAQLICQQIYYPILEEVMILDNTERAEGEFGSTGNN